LNPASLELYLSWGTFFFTAKSVTAVLAAS